MAITELLRARLRLDLGDSGSTPVFPDVEVDDAYARGEEKYGTGSAALEVVFAYARVVLIKQLRASSARMVTYQQNQSSENLSDVQKFLKALSDEFESALKKAADEFTAAQSGGIRFGGMRGGKPHRVKEIPS